VLIGPGVIIGRVGATTAMNIVEHILIEKLAQVIVEPEVLVTTPRQCWLRYGRAMRHYFQPGSNRRNGIVFEALSQ